MSSTILKLSCPDRVGLLARITTFFAHHGGNLLEVHQFVDPVSRWFFTRVAIETKTLALELPALRKAFRPLAEDLNAEWSLRPTEEKQRVIILVSKMGHCMADLLWRWRSGELPVEIPMVISNHGDLQGMVEREGIPFRHIPIPDEGDRGPAFKAMLEECIEAKPDVIVTARYMRVLPDFFCEAFPGRIINIHHSFLPAFEGANPYRRAYDRGVKLIGATCHYVTRELDAGPIIEQTVERVEHYHLPEEMLRLGRDCERLALARGVRYHVTDRVLVHGNRTVVFRD